MFKSFENEMRKLSLIIQFDIIDKRFIENQSKSNKKGENTLKQDLFLNEFENNINADDEVFSNSKINIIIENVLENRSKSLKLLSKKSKRINFLDLIKSKK